MIDMDLCQRKTGPGRRWLARGPRRYDRLRRAGLGARDHAGRDLRHGHLPCRAADRGIELPNRDQHPMLHAQPGRLSFAIEGELPPAAKGLTGLLH